MHIFSRKRTRRTWVERKRTRGTYRRFRRTGNNFATGLPGIDIFLLDFIRTIWPKISTAEINTFIFSAMECDKLNLPTPTNTAYKIL